MVRGADWYFKPRTVTYKNLDWRGWEPREDKMETPTSGAQMSTPKEPKKRKVRVKNVKFKLPKGAPRPMRALWDSASQEEKEKAHQAAAAILENWLGQASREEIAKKLGVPPLRIWQMSQQALVGLVAALLKQPKARKEAPASLPPEEDPVKLKKRIAGLERDLAMMKELVGLLKEFPAHREGKEVSEDEGTAGKKKKAKISPGTDKKGGSVAVSEGKRTPPAVSGPEAGSD